MEEGEGGRDVCNVKHLYIVRPLMVLIEIFAKHSALWFLLTFLILFAGSKN